MYCSDLNSILIPFIDIQTQNNAVDTASFLLQCTSSLPNAEEISAQLLGGDYDNQMEEEKKDEDVETASNTNAILESPPLSPFVSQDQSPLQIELSCTNPRGKFLLQLHENGILLTNPKKTEETVTIAASSVENIILFRKGEEYKKLKQPSGKKPLPGHMMLICLKSEGVKVVFRNKDLTQICLQLPSYSMESTNSDGQFSEQQWWEGLNTALCSDGGKMIRVHAKMDRPSFEASEAFTFQSEGSSGSSTTTEGMPYVSCYHGLNDGELYPLREGLLFFK